jgi:hypothetical protein
MAADICQAQAAWLLRDSGKRIADIGIYGEENRLFSSFGGGKVTQTKLI